MTHGRPFKIYRIICTINGKALVIGSDLPHHHRTPPLWYSRGQWTVPGVFWRTEAGIKKHLLQFCHDWKTVRVDGYEHYWTDDNGTIRSHWIHAYWYQERITETPDYTRLDHLCVEETTVNDHSVAEVNAKDFIGLQVAPEAIEA